MGSKTRRTLTEYHVGHLCRIRLTTVQMIPSSAGTWTSNLGRYHRLARQAPVRKITDTRGSPTAARRGWIPETVWSFCSSWRLTCSKVKWWNSIQNRSAALLPSSSREGPRSRFRTDGRISSFQTDGNRARARLGEKVYEWASDVASCWGHSRSEGTAASANRSEPSNRSFLSALSSLSAPLSRCLEEVQQDRMATQDYERRSGRRTREAERWGSSGWRCSLLIALSLRVCQSRYEEIRASHSYQSLKFTLCPHCWLSIVCRFKAASLLFLSYSLM